jgi:phage tail-like protein
MNRREIEPLLPRNFQRTLGPGTPLDALLDVMEALHAPSEAVLRQLEVFFDPRRAPDRFVPFLARWVDLGQLIEQVAANQAAGAEFPSGIGRLRELVGLAAYFSKWRGTRTGLQRFLEVATGLTGYVIDEDPGGRPFHLSFQAPEGSEPYRDLIEQIVELEKPAYVTYDLAFG